VWLEVASIIQQQSHGAKSFDDFARLFYGGTNNGPETKTYTFDQLVAALNQVAPYDWAPMLRERLNSNSSAAPTQGVEAMGWKLEFNDQQPRGGRGGNRAPSGVLYSIGMTVNPQGVVTDSLWGGPAFQAGIAPGMRVLGVNGNLYNSEVLSDAIAASKDKPIELLVAGDNDYHLTTLHYQGTERYPHLVRDDSKPDYLDELIKAR